MHALYPPTPSSLTTINETRDIHIPQFYLHAIPYNPKLTQLYKQETDNQFQIPALDYTKDHLHSRVTKATNPYDFWFKSPISNFHFFESVDVQFQKVNPEHGPNIQARGVYWVFLVETIDTVVLC